MDTRELIRDAWRMVVAPLSNDGDMDGATKAHTVDKDVA